ncbi:MAG: hexose kinase [Anaerolineae bacterium]|nr:hexose kinase [Candidatus Roseilinea sp.]MDW8451020.1 hexose kinase [Anaerolineae bacterium]
MILCVTPNPALDRTLVVPDFRLHGVSRATQVLTVAGGKGLNVARGVIRLGGRALCAGLLGGHTGRHFAQLAEAEGLLGEWTWHAAETRCATIIVDGSGRDASLINEPGPPISDETWQQFAQSVLACAAAHRVSAVTFSGSVPAGPTPAMFAALLEACRTLDPEVWVDSSGEWLRAAVNVPGVNVKVNGDEIAALAGHVVESPADALVVAHRLRTRHGWRRCIITLGGRGVAMVGVSGSWIAQPPAVPSVSSIGSGDVFLGALVHGLDEGATEADALRSAAAAGAANAMSVGGGRFALEDYRAALAGTRLTLGA